MAHGARHTRADRTLDTFFSILNTSGQAAASHANQLVTAVFSADNGLSGKKARPCVAVTEHGEAVGPAFFGAKEVITLFSQLFESFPDVALTPLSDLRLYSPYGRPKYTPIKIGIIADLTGSYTADWFGRVGPGGKSHYSPPLSDLHPNPAKPKKISIPAVAIFTFDGKHKIEHLAIYMDRYKFIPQVSLQGAETTGNEVSALLSRLTTPHRG